MNWREILVCRILILICRIVIEPRIRGFVAGPDTQIIEGWLQKELKNLSNHLNMKEERIEGRKAV